MKTKKIILALLKIIFTIVLVSFFTISLIYVTQKTNPVETFDPVDKVDCSDEKNHRSGHCAQRVILRDGKLQLVAVTYENAGSELFFIMLTLIISTIITGLVLVIITQDSSDKNGTGM